LVKNQENLQMFTNFLIVHQIFSQFFQIVKSPFFLFFHKFWAPGLRPAGKSQEQQLPG